jgi:hypothetical protein
MVDPDGVESEHLVLGRPGDVQGHLPKLEAWIEGLIHRAAPCHVYVERHTRRGEGSQTLDAYTNVARLVAARHGVPCNTKVAALTARKLALGKGIQDKAESASRARMVLRLAADMSLDEVDARVLLAAIPHDLTLRRAQADLRKRVAAAKARVRSAAKRLATANHKALVA